MSSSEADEVPDHVRGYLDKLKEQITSLQSRNVRLQQKLENAQTYNEELRLQLKSLASKSLSGGMASSKATQTELEVAEEEPSSWSDTARQGSIADQVTAVAAEVARDQFLQGMAYEKTSGLYYDFKTGFYFDAERSLYYDGHSGIYYSYNYDTSSYEVHSQVDDAKRGERRRRPPVGQRKRAAESDHSSAVASGAEEGELLSSDEASSACHSSEDEGDPAQPKPLPCVRLMVVESSFDLHGRLFIVSCTGGSIGREGSHEVLLSAEQGCSKSHAKIMCDHDGKYFMVDLGSRNGTFINNQPLSPDSEAKEIGHGTVIQIGTTKLVCHVHPGRETCLQCEPGVVQVAKAVLAKAPAPCKEDSRREGLRQLKKKYGLRRQDQASDSLTEPAYQDRAHQRRRIVGSDNPYEKTETAHLEIAISNRNKGFEILSRMGWSEGQGLGKKADGRVEPLPLDSNSQRSGLGSIAAPHTVDHQPLKSALLQKTQERFNRIPDDS